MNDMILQSNLTTICLHYGCASFLVALGWVVGRSIHPVWINKCGPDGVWGTPVVRAEADCIADHR